MAAQQAAVSPWVSLHFHVFHWPSRQTRTILTYNLWRKWRHCSACLKKKKGEKNLILNDKIITNLKKREFLCWYLFKGITERASLSPSCFYAMWISQPLTGLPQSWPVLQVAMIPRPVRQRGTDMLNTALIYYGRHTHTHTCACCFVWKLEVVVW